MDQAIRTDLGVRKFAYRQIGRKCYRQKGVEVSQQQLTGEATAAHYRLLRGRAFSDWREAICV